MFRKEKNSRIYEIWTVWICNRMLERKTAMKWRVEQNQTITNGLVCDYCGWGVIVTSIGVWESRPSVVELLLDIWLVYKKCCRFCDMLRVHRELIGMKSSGEWVWSLCTLVRMHVLSIKTKTQHYVSNAGWGHLIMWITSLSIGRIYYKKSLNYHSLIIIRTTTRSRGLVAVI